MKPLKLAIWCLYLQPVLSRLPKTKPVSTCLNSRKKFQLNGPFTNIPSLSWPDVSLLPGIEATAAAATAAH